MKKLLILTLSLITFFGYSQTLVDPSLTPTTARINAAIADAISASGTDTYTGTKSGLINVSGRAYSVTFTNANTGSATFNLNAGGAVTIRKFESGSLVNLVAGDIADGETKRLRYNGTYLVIEGGSGSSVETGTVEQVTGTSPIVITGTPTTTPNVTINNAAADGSTKGAASFTANDFNASSGNISIDYTNGQSASGSNKGFLTSSDWTTFNGKQSSITFGTGVQTALGVNIGSAGAPVLFNGSAGTPSSITLTNATGLPVSTGISGLGTGVATWLETPSWTNFNSAITGAAPFWSLASGGTLTGANTITGTTSNTLKAVFNSLGSSVTTVTPGAGMWFANNTAATSGNQQTSPWLVFEGQGFATGTGLSTSAKMAIGLLPIQGTLLGVNFPFMVSTAGGAYVSVFNVTGSGPSAGTYGFTSGASISSISNTMTLQGQNAAANAFQFLQGYTSAVTNGNAMRFTQGFSPTSGSTTWNAMTIDGTINQTGGASGKTSFINITPTYTSAANVSVIDYAPTGTPTAHVFLRAVSGNVLLGGTSITASTRVDQHGLGTTSSTINHRWANSSNTALAQITDDGAVHLSSNIVGRAVLVGGTVTVSTSVVQSTDEIFLTNRITGGTVGFLSVGTVTNGTSFVINSSSATDTSTISWMIVKKAP